jgi:hypothetical protein
MDCWKSGGFSIALASVIVCNLQGRRIEWSEEIKSGKDNENLKKRSRHVFLRTLASVYAWDYLNR